MSAVIDLAAADLVDDAAPFFAPMSFKVCSRCKAAKPLTRFGKNPRARNGLKYACFDCTNAASAAYRLTHPELEKAKKAKYRGANRDVIATYSAKYRSMNRAKCLDLNRAWRRNNPDKARAATANWQARNKHALRINNQNRRARKAVNGGKISRDIASRLMRLQRGKCAACKTSLRKFGHHLDHITALVNGGRHEDQNMQLLCPTCNMSKHAKHPVDFMQSRGFLL